MKVSTTFSAAIFIGLMLIIFSARAEFPLTLRSVNGQAQLFSAGKKVPANPRRELHIGDELITEDGGEVEISMGTSGHISVHANSKLAYGAIPGVESVDSEKSMLELVSGNACVQLDVGRDDGRVLRIKANPFFRAQLKRGHVCFERHGADGMVHLVGGTVQIEHKLSGSVLVLSEAGTRYEVFGDGNGNLQLPDYALNALRDETSKPTIEHEHLPINDSGPAQPVAVPEAGEAAKRTSGERNPVASANENPGMEQTDEESAGGTAHESDTAKETAVAGVERPEPIIPAQPETDDAPAIAEPVDFPKGSAPGAEDNGLRPTPQGKYVVYLFSTQSLDEAEKVNSRLLKAGHDTRVFEAMIDGVQRFRVGLDGFASKTEAKKFSGSVKGKLGITETWITYGEDY